jgi:hypothetical protein
MAVDEGKGAWIQLTIYHNFTQIRSFTNSSKFRKEFLIKMLLQPKLFKRTASGSPFTTSNAVKNTHINLCTKPHCTQISKHKEKTMNTYTVYHRKELFEIDIFETDMLKLCWPEEYQLVATVEAENLEQAYAKTQHIDQEQCPPHQSFPLGDRGWWENPGVELLEKSRSTSVSDIIIGPNRHVMVVMGMGFTDLSVEIGHRILDETEEAFGLRSLILERADFGNQPRPVSIPDYLFWLEEEARLQAGQLYNDILFYNQHEAYVRTLFGLVMELRAWGFTPSLPPWAVYALSDTEVQTFGSLVEAACALPDDLQLNDHDVEAAPIRYLLPVPGPAIEAALERVQDDQAHPIDVSMPVNQH